MNIVQSYLTTVVRGDFSLYEVRIFVKIVEHANKLLKGKTVKEAMATGITADGITANITVPIREILTDNSNDYQKVYAACKSLSAKSLELYNADDGRWMTVPTQEKGTMYYAHLIDNIRYRRGSGKINFTCAVWLLQYIVNFVNNQFSLYDLTAALSLPTPYAVRMYWLTCSMTQPVTFAIDTLRKMLGLEGRYKTSKDFVKRVLLPPMKVLEERKLNGYIFKTVKKNPDARTSKVTHITIIPIKRQQPSQQKINTQIPLSSVCPSRLRMYLMQQCNFTESDLKKNQTTLFYFARLKDYEQKIVDICEHARKARGGVGYYINAMKSEIEAARRNQPLAQRRPSTI